MQTIQISDLKHRILSAMALELDTTPDAIVDRVLDDIVVNRAGIRPEFGAATVEGIVQALEFAAAEAKARREVPANADAGTIGSAPETVANDGTGE